MKYIENPNIPQGQVSVAAVSAYATEEAGALLSMGVTVVPVEACSKLMPGVASHADLQLCHLGGALVMTASCSKNTKDLLVALGFELLLAENELEAAYPKDCALNVAIVKNYIFANQGVIDPAIRAWGEQQGKEPINVRQGYARCSTGVVAADAIITADDSIAQAAENLGIDLLKIQPGNILLPGYDYGFIGGCCGLLESGLLAFAGNVDSHPESDSIKSFCRNRGVYIESLGKGMLKDIGGILPLAEK